MLSGGQMRIREKRKLRNQESNDSGINQTPRKMFARENPTLMNETPEKNVSSN